jgi:hypothetical protein
VSTAAASRAAPQLNIRIVPEDQHRAFHATLQQRIAERAHQLFLEHGGNVGDDVSDWYQAEREVLHRVSEVRVSGVWCIADAALLDAEPESLQVLVLGHRAIISGYQPSAGQSFAYLLVNWPAHVDPSTATAHVKNKTLTVKAKHSPST